MSQRLGLSMHQASLGSQLPEDDELELEEDELLPELPGGGDTGSRSSEFENLFP